jgi:hypothetical protein
MQSKKHLTKRQRDVIDDLFAGVVEEQQVLASHKVDRRLFDKWMADENFINEFDRRLASARRKSDLIIARFAYLAASKLALLTESENQETARRACLDIISLLRKDKPASQDETADNSENHPDELPPELAGRLLAALANAEAQPERFAESPLGAESPQGDEKQRTIQK